MTEDKPNLRPVKLTAEQAFDLAVQLHKEFRLDDAEEAYRQLLLAMPDHPDVLHFLGVLLHQTGRSEEGVPMIRSAISLAPGNPGMRNNLGNVLKEMGKLEGAVESYRIVIELAPESAEAWNNLGVAHKARRDLKEAERCCRRAVELTPDYADAHHNLGNVLYHQHRQEEAATCYRKAIELRPYDADSYRYLGMALYSVGKTAEAEAVFRQWVAFDPENEVARHLLAGCTGEDVPGRASDHFVKHVFDKFASSFDTKLESLDYRAPELVCEALAAELGEPAKDLEVLDAGCGTGLAAPLLAPYARRLTGVDLSPRMLDNARGRGLYDELAEAELTAWLGERPGMFDVIASIDTLVYFGDLEDVARAAAGALRPGGLLACSVERLDESAGGEEFRLNPSGRYSHAESYVRRVLGNAGLEVRSLTIANLRREAENPVSGLVVLAARGEDA